MNSGFLLCCLCARRRLEIVLLVRSFWIYVLFVQIKVSQRLPLKSLVSFEFSFRIFDVSSHAQSSVWSLTDCCWLTRFSFSHMFDQPSVYQWNNECSWLLNGLRISLILFLKHTFSFAWVDRTENMGRFWFASSFFYCYNSFLCHDCFSGFLKVKREVQKHSDVCSVCCGDKRVMMYDLVMWRAERQHHYKAWSWKSIPRCLSSCQRWGVRRKTCSNLQRLPAPVVSSL